LSHVISDGPSDQPKSIGVTNFGRSTCRCRNRQICPHFIFVYSLDLGKPSVEGISGGRARGRRAGGRAGGERVEDGGHESGWTVDGGQEDGA
jgi:hypothetical protein